MLQVPGTDILTQARKLSEAPQMAREVIALEMDLPMSEVEVELHIGSIGNVDNVSDTADSIRAARAQAAQLERQALKHSEELAQSLARRRSHRQGHRRTSRGDVPKSPSTCTAQLTSGPGCREQPDLAGNRDQLREQGGHGHHPGRG